jgi:hypothetical protein
MPANSVICSESEISFQPSPIDSCTHQFHTLRESSKLANPRISFLLFDFTFLPVEAIIPANAFLTPAPRMHFDPRICLF